MTDDAIAKSHAAFEAAYSEIGGNIERAPAEWGNGPYAYKWEDTTRAYALWCSAVVYGLTINY